MAQRRTYALDAIVCHQTKLGESDLILILISSDGSQIRAVAKGARKGGGRMAARVGLFCECNFLIAKGKNLDVISEAQLKNAHVGLRMTPENMYAASRVAELASLVSLEDVADPYIFAILDRALSSLEEVGDNPHLDLLVSAFTFKLLAHGGWRPELRFCTQCGSFDSEFFSSETGGLVCESCAMSVAGARRLGLNELAWLRALLSRTFAELMVDEIDASSAGRLLDMAHEWAEAQLDVRLRSFVSVL